MPRQNYRHMKKQKEESRKARQAEKRQRRQTRVDEAPGVASDEAQDPGSPAVNPAASDKS